MNEAAWRPELLQTAIVDVGVGMGRFEGRSSGLYEEEGRRTESGESEGSEVQGECLSFRGEASWAEGRGLIANADRGVAEGMDFEVEWICEKFGGSGGSGRGRTWDFGIWGETVLTPFINIYPAMRRREILLLYVCIIG